jgi:hypothetical protein
MPESWDILNLQPPKVLTPVTVGVVDTGVLRTHPEFTDPSHKPNVAIDPWMPALRDGV